MQEERTAVRIFSDFALRKGLSSLSGAGYREAMVVFARLFPGNTALHLVVRLSVSEKMLSI